MWRGQRAPILRAGGVAAASLAVSLAACAHHGEVASLDIVRDSTLLASGSSVLGSAPITVGDFEFKATNGGLKSRWAPMIVQVTVTVTNVSQHAAALNVLGGNCEVLIRVYAHHIPPKAPAYDAFGARRVVLRAGLALRDDARAVGDIAVGVRRPWRVSRARAIRSRGDRVGVGFQRDPARADPGGVGADAAAVRIDPASIGRRLGPGVA